MTKKPKDEDPEQSKRFLETARKLVADGDLSPTDDGSALEKLMKKAAPTKRPARN